MNIFVPHLLLRLPREAEPPCNLWPCLSIMAGPPYKTILSPSHPVCGHQRTEIVSQTKVSETDLTVHLQKALLPAGFVMPAGNVGMFVSASLLASWSVRSLFHLLSHGSCSGSFSSALLDCSEQTVLASPLSSYFLTIFIFMKCCFHPHVYT